MTVASSFSQETTNSDFPAKNIQSLVLSYSYDKMIKHHFFFAMP